MRGYICMYVYVCTSNVCCSGGWGVGQDTCKKICLNPPTPLTTKPHQNPTGSNGAKVLSAPVTVVFAADLESARTMPRVVALLRKAGAFPEAFLAKVCE